MQKVTKRDGRKEEYSVEKVKNAIAWATEGLGVNPLELESRVDQIIYDGITTRDIHENLIHHARALCSPEAPDWNVVAGRLFTMLRWKKTGAYEITLNEFIDEQIRIGLYRNKDKAGLHFGFTEEQIDELEQYMDTERDLDHSYASVFTAEKKYLLDGENIQHMFMLNAMIMASVEKPRERMKWAKEFYDHLSLRKISLATPWLANLRSNGNISSCFIISIDDSIDSIFDNIKRAALISKNGGGLGVDLSHIRATGSSVAGVDKASGGVLGWSKILNDTAVAVNQNGKRAGAFTLALPIWHRDIEDFLEIQSENGDQRKKAHDVFPQVAIHDIFMKEQAKEDGGIWYTFCPYEVKQKLEVELTGVYGKEFSDRYRRCVAAAQKGKLENFQVYNARALFKHILKRWVETGLPYIAWIDTINALNPNKHDGSIPCVNLCTESFSNVQMDKYAHTCNLASLVVGRLHTKEEIIRAARVATRMLDNGIELTSAPVEISAAHNNRYRTIGVGIQGLHDYLAYNKLGYKNLKEISELAELIEYGCVQESVQLAKERGAYPAFEGSMWFTGELIEHFNKNSVAELSDWNALQEEINKHGIRNSQLTSPAPNTSTSIFMDAAAGVMPVYASFFYEDNKNGKMPVVAMHLTENPLEYERTFPRQNQLDLVKAVAAIQKFTDTGVSAEYCFDQNKEGFKAKDLYDMACLSWSSGCKAIYYVRSIKPGQTVDAMLGVETVCAGCAG